MKIKLDPGAYMPERAYKYDAGLDIRSRENKTVPAGGSAVFDTGVHVQIPIGCVGLLESKSGLNVNHDITSDGVIDAGFGGAIKVKLYNYGAVDYHVHIGDKISQLLIVPVILVDCELVQHFDAGERGDNGFGSTGR